MWSSRKKVTIAAASLPFLAITAKPANNAEELVFSTPGSVMTLTDNGIATHTDFGFWIWCAFSASPASTPATYQGAHEISISPQSAFVAAGQSLQFTATVTGDTSGVTVCQGRSLLSEGERPFFHS